MPNGSIFETIVRRTGQSDFCIFDDRETEMRPESAYRVGSGDRPGQAVLLSELPTEADGFACGPVPDSAFMVCVSPSYLVLSYPPLHRAFPPTPERHVDWQ